MACPQLGVILAYWKQTGVSSPKNPIALAVGVSKLFQCDPILLDEDVPFFYNEAVYDFINEVEERFSVRLQPSSQDLKIEVFTGEERMAYLDFTVVMVSAWIHEGTHLQTKAHFRKHIGWR